MIQELQLASPVLAIGIVSIIAVLVDVLSGKDKNIIYLFSILGLAVTGLAAAYTLFLPQETITNFDVANSITAGMISFGGYAAFFDILFCVAGILVLFASKPYLEQHMEEDSKEFYLMLLFSIVGMVLIAHTANLLTLFIGIELMSISFYVMAGFFRRSIHSVEAALKYFLLGAFATGFLLYGMSLIYGSAGSTDLATIAHQIQSGNVTPLFLVLGMGLLTVGLSFKIAAFPFHQWAPDVYQGSPTIVTAFMSTAGKAAALIGFIIVGKSVIQLDVANELLQASSEKIQMIIAIISAATMLVGNISALVQKNIKRMLAYSSVAHAGYLLMGIVANTPEGWSGIVFYSTAYMFMQIGAFVVVSILEKKDGSFLQVEDYVGLRKNNPMLAGIMAVFMFSLAGLPPFAGFFGKYYLFVAAVESGFTWLTIVAVISSIVSMYFYIGLIVNMFFKEAEQPLAKIKSGSAAITLVLSVVGILFFGAYPSILIDLANSLF